MTSKPPCGVKDRLNHQPWPLSARRLMCILQTKKQKTLTVCVCVCMRSQKQLHRRPPSMFAWVQCEHESVHRVCMCVFLSTHRHTSIHHQTRKRHLFTLVTLLQSYRVLCSLKHPWGQRRYDRTDFKRHTSKTTCTLASAQKYKRKKFNVIMQKKKDEIGQNRKYKLQRH